MGGVLDDDLLKEVLDYFPGSTIVKVSSYEMKNNRSDRWPDFEKAVHSCTTYEGLEKVIETFYEEITGTWPNNWRNMANMKIEDQKFWIKYNDSYKRSYDSICSRIQETSSDSNKA